MMFLSTPMNSLLLAAMRPALPCPCTSAAVVGTNQWLQRVSVYANAQLLGRLNQHHPLHNILERRNEKKPSIPPAARYLG